MRSTRICSNRNLREEAGAGPPTPLQEGLHLPVQYRYRIVGLWLYVVMTPAEWLQLDPAFKGTVAAGDGFHTGYGWPPGTRTAIVWEKGMHVMPVLLEREES